ncbi:hypothetical protein SAMN06265360_11247 [Haloechinothrix alba]|uniref:Uncharacterized protein n=1 Tax=Haloechinothrix alba TaxID=664784 RepID=A0A238XS91_9PSEU|nr:hypothetical protein SAMN06265360_11247 [Haloechinothrix alba]
MARTAAVTVRAGPPVPGGPPPLDGVVTRVRRPRLGKTDPIVCWFVEVSREAYNGSQPGRFEYVAPTRISRSGFVVGGYRTRPERIP